jgi:hypothetical protein
MEDGVRAPSFFFLLASITFSGMSGYVRPHLLSRPTTRKKRLAIHDSKTMPPRHFPANRNPHKFFVGFAARGRFTGDK